MIFNQKFSFGFSLLAKIEKKTFQKFNERYVGNLEKFYTKVKTFDKQVPKMKKSAQKYYNNPYHDSHHPVYPSGMKWLQTMSEVSGPEQVSPHYENFSFARRHAITFWMGLLLLRFLGSTEDIFVFAQSSVQAWCFLFSYLYFYIEGKKYFLMPMLTRFYSKISIMELQNLQSYYQVNVQVRCRNLMALGRHYIMFKTVHNQYLPLRNCSLLHFMINQQIRLKNHLNSRVQALFSEVEQVQEANRQWIFNNVIGEKIKNCVDNVYVKHKEEIQARFFEIALQSIAKGRMTFQNDPLLPYVIELINETVSQFGNISLEDQMGLAALSDQQMKRIKENDARRRDQFLEEHPKIDGSLKNNEIVKKILSKWGNY